MLAKTKNELYHYENNVKVIGKNVKMFGDCSNLRGDCSELRGDCSGLRENCSDLRGDLSLCEITEEEREKGIDIGQLIKTV